MHKSSYVIPRFAPDWLRLCVNMGSMTLNIHIGINNVVLADLLVQVNFPLALIKRQCLLDSHSLSFPSQTCHVIPTQPLHCPRIVIMATSQHNTWIKAIACNLICGLYNKAPHVLHKCVTCSKTICKNCSDSGKELDSKHSSADHDPDWKPREPVKKRREQRRGIATLTTGLRNNDHMLPRSQPHFSSTSTSQQPP